MKKRSKSEPALVASMLLMTSCSNAYAFPFPSNAVKKEQKKEQKKAAASSQAVSAIHDKWAVLIGVSNFKDTAIPPIKYGAESAVKLARVFLDSTGGNFKNDHMVVLMQDDATKATIEDVLSNGVTSKCLPGDLVIIYISSRWAPSKDGKNLIVLSSDSKLASQDESGLDLGSLLSTVRRRTQSRNILCLLDLSPVKEGASTEAILQTLAKGKSSQPGVIARLAELANVNVISANNLASSSAQTPFTESSYFCRFLMEDLKGSSGTITIGNLARTVAEQVHTTVQGEQKLDQQPESSVNVDTLANVAIGLIINKGKNLLVAAGLPASLATMKFGIESGRMAIDHPEMLPGSGIGTAVPAPASRGGKKSYGAQAQAPGAVASSSPPTVRDKGEKSVSSAKLKPENQDDKDDETPSQDLDLTPYIATAKKTIQAKWQPARGLENYKVTTVFTILRDGTIQDAQVVDPSGIALVDQAALSALKAASPLPALPSGSPKSIQLRYKFQWNVHKN